MAPRELFWLDRSGSSYFIHHLDDVCQDGAANSETTAFNLPAIERPRGGSAFDPDLDR
jgi:hypothetical protein